MKTFFTYILLTTLVFRPVYTACYVGYFELNIDDIIENYCINKEKPKLQCKGRCHLVKQLNLPDNNTTPYSSTITEIFVPVYFKTISLNIEGNTNSIKNIQSYFKYLLPHYIKPNHKITPPPKLS